MPEKSLFVFLLILISCNFLNGVAVNHTKSHLRDAHYRLAEDFYKQRLQSNKCPNQFDCGEKCVDLVAYRNGIKDCSDGSDEDCWPGGVKCSNNNMCVDEADQQALCVSPSDSKYCQMPDDVFLCKNRNCILNLWVNDGKNDCGDWSDELSTIIKTKNANT